jgi:hypothetical protein
MVELKLFRKTFGRNNTSDNFVIIYIMFVRSQEKPHFCGCSSSIKKGSSSSGLLASVVGSWI